MRPWAAGVQEGSTARCVRALPAVTLRDTGGQENARTPAVMVGNLVAEIVAQCRA